MANFVPTKVVSADLEKAQNFSGLSTKVSTSPFQEGATFTPTGEIEYFATKSDKGEPRYHATLVGTINGTTTNLWLSMFFKSGYCLEEKKEIVSGGFNADVRNIAKISEKSNKEAAEAVLALLKDGNVYKSLGVSKKFFVTLFKGEKVQRSLCEFTIV